MAGYPPVYYVAAAAALGVAKWSGMTVFHAYTLARLANFTCFMLLGVATLTVARRGQAWFFCILLLPMTLCVAASISQDGQMVASATLAAAMLTRAAASAPEATSRSPWYLGSALLIACVAAAKPPYLPLVAMLLLPLPLPVARLGAPEIRRRLVAIALASAVALGWTALELHVAAVPVLMDPYEAGPLWPGARPAVFGGTDISAQLHVILSNSRGFLDTLATVLRHDTIMPLGVIGVFGWLNLWLPNWMYWLWGLALVAGAVSACFGEQSRASGSRWLEAPLLLTAGLISGLGFYVVEYLTWTPVGLNWIGGVQGRYMLPLLPLIAMTLPCPRVPGGIFVSRFLLAVPVAAAVASLLFIPRLIVLYYYLG